MESVDNVKVLAFFWWVYKFLGASAHGVRYKNLYRLHTIFIVLGAGVSFPLHQFVSMLSQTPGTELFKTLFSFLIIVTSNLQVLLVALKQNRLRKAEVLLRQLDIRSKTAEEVKIFKKAARIIRILKYWLLSWYFFSLFMGLVAVLLSKERQLIYPGWLPFDWRGNTLYFWIGVSYQLFFLFFMCFINFASDCLPAVLLIQIAQHLQSLAVRLSKLGYNCSEKQENEKELKRCITDHLHLYDLFAIVQDLLYWPLFVQFSISALAMCLSMALLTFSDNMADRSFIFLISFSTILKIYPACYYGTYIEILFDHLHHDIFCSNWPDQTTIFKKYMIILTERSLKPAAAEAGGIFRVNLNFFVATLRASYSLLAILTNRKF